MKLWEKLKSNFKRKSKFDRLMDKIQIHHLMISLEERINKIEKNEIPGIIERLQFNYGTVYKDIHAMKDKMRLHKTHTTVRYKNLAEDIINHDESFKDIRRAFHSLDEMVNKSMDKFNSIAFEHEANKKLAFKEMKKEIVQKIKISKDILKYEKKLKELICGQK